MSAFLFRTNTTTFMATLINTSVQKREAFLFIVFAILMLAAFMADAQQSKKPGKTARYKGFEAGFGVRSFTINSDIEAINNLQVTQEGGHAGVVAGNNIVRTRASIGLFYSSDKVCQTVDMFEADASANLFPLQLMTSADMRIEPYIIGSVSYNKLKMYGRYLDNDLGKINYSKPKEDLLGTINQVRASLGTGVEFRIVDDFDFIHLYTEVRYALPVTAGSKNNDFKNTSASDQWMISLGVRFGAFR
jgi:hypothetical protein